MLMFLYKVQINFKCLKSSIYQNGILSFDLKLKKVSALTAKTNIIRITIKNVLNQLNPWCLNSNFNFKQESHSTMSKAIEYFKIINLSHGVWIETGKMLGIDQLSSCY